MKYVTDETLHGRAAIASGPLDVLRTAAARGLELGESCYSGAWTGREITGWEDLEPAYLRPWAEGTDKVNAMVEQIKNSEVATPVNLRRKARWSDADGEVDVDRALRGEGECLRLLKRAPYHGPTTIALMLHIGGRGEVTAEEMFWRGAAAVATLDRLEDAGFACEVWCWNRAWHTFQNPNHEFFTCFKFKDAGEPVDVQSLVNCTAPWFFRTAVFALRSAAGARRIGAGGTMNYLGGWEKYMDVTEGIKQVHMPVVTSEGSAVRAAEKILAEVAEGEIVNPMY